MDTQTLVPPPPPVVARPAFARWLWERSLDFRAAGDVVGRTHEYVRLICLPFGDPKRRKPDDDVLSIIVAWTEGEITAADFYPPHLNGSAFPAETAEAVAQ